MWKTIVNVLDEFVGHAFGFPDCHPSCFLGVAVLDPRDFRLMLLSVDAGFVVLWWFENWIVDASKMRDFFGFDFFAFINFNRLLLLESLDRFVIV